MCIYIDINYFPPIFIYRKGKLLRRVFSKFAMLTCHTQSKEMNLVAIDIFAGLVKMCFFTKKRLKRFKRLKHV